MGFVLIDKCVYRRSSQLLPRSFLIPAIIKVPPKVPAMGVGTPAKVPTTNPLASADPVSSSDMYF